METSTTQFFLMSSTARWTLKVLALLALLTVETRADMAATEGNMTKLDQQISEVSEAFRVHKGTKLKTLVKMLQDTQQARTSRPCDPTWPYRMADGWCNNLKHPEWGTSLDPYLRWLHAAYDGDGLGRPRLFRNLAEDSQLPSARRVSVSCDGPGFHADQDKIHSNLLMQWGQFLVHDIMGTPELQGHDCCEGMGEDGVHADYYSDGPCIPIPIPEGDRHFKTNCLPLSRSMAVTVNGVREQVNVLTATIDASAVYGSVAFETNELRLHQGGRLRTSAMDMLPYSNSTTCALPSNGQEEACFDAGDSRVNVFPGLTVMHLLFVREHNRLANELAWLNPHWDDEKIFQETRRIVIAIMQKITYEDYLPKILGRHYMDMFGLKHRYAYDSTLRLGIFNAAASAAARFGHSQIKGFYRTLHNLRHPLATLYFRPHLLTEDHGKGVDAILSGLVEDPEDLADRYFSTGISDELFQNISSPGKSLDLVAVNVQRGRDHGLPRYVDFLDKALHIIPSTSAIEELRLPLCLSEAYDSIEDVDLFVGGMAEKPVKGGVVGPTFAAILAAQFQLLRSADRFFYETENRNVGFTRAQLRQISRYTLSKLICRNSGLKRVQKDAFDLKSARNRDVSCSDVGTLDLMPWRQIAPAGKK